MHLFLDFTRVATRIVRSSPTGIDRVEYAYITEALKRFDEAALTPVLTTPLFTGAVSHALARKVMARVETSWQAPIGPGEDTVYQALKALLEAPIDPARKSAQRVQSRSRAEVARRGAMFPLASLVRAGGRLRRALALHGKGPSAYLHTSHTQLERAHRFGWLKGTTIKPVFFLHDAIPIDFPEFCSPGSGERHMGRLRTVSALAALIIVNSQYTASRITAFLSAQGMRVPEIEVVPLGIEASFSQSTQLDPPAGAPPYFVCMGTIEPRKNLQFLFAVWRRLAEAMGPQTPRLVVAGRRGWENENVVDILERSQQLAPFLIEVKGLSDAGIASLLKGARALLAPSFVEGFGLPIVEALAVPAPVIASDIPAHKEVAAGAALFIDPTDGPGWARAIRSYCELEFSQRAAEIARPHAALRALSWEAHVGRALDAVRRVAAPGARSTP